MKNSQDWSEVLAGYVLGDLSSEEMIQVQHHLTEHPEATAQLTELQNTLALLPLGLPDRPVPDNLRDQILTIATAEMPIAVTASSPTSVKPNNVVDLTQARSRQQSAPRRGWIPIAGGIAAAAIAALGVQNYQLQQQIAGTRREIASLQQGDREQMTTLAATNGRTLAMRGSGPVAGADGKVYIVPQQNRALLVIDHLPQPPSGKVYHLWAIVNGQKVSCIQFTPEQDGKVVMQIPATRWQQAVEVNVTLEAEQSDAMPSGEMVMQGEQI